MCTKNEGPCFGAGGSWRELSACYEPFNGDENGRSYAN